MDLGSNIRDFLVSRRARVRPDDVGLPVQGRPRRVAGLRREEVAVLAGISVEYYTRIERGRLRGASPSVLDAIASALRLNDIEREHLRHLAMASEGASRPVRPRPRRRVAEHTQWLLDAMRDVPAFVRNGRLDILASNALGRALYQPLFAGAAPPNTARFAFLDPVAKDFFGADWPSIAHGVADVLRAEAGRHPFDAGLQDLIGELSTRSEDFRRVWADQGVLRHSSGQKRFQHPIVGELTLTFHAFDMTGEPDHVLLTYSAEPGSSAQASLQLLANWAYEPPTDIRTTTFDKENHETTHTG